MSGFIRWIKAEAAEAVLPLVFFLVSFQAIALSRALMLEQYGIAAGSFIEVTIAALVVAKVVLIADHLPFINRFPDRPLMHNIVWKTAIYQLAAIAVRYAEHWVRFARKYGMADANTHLFEEIKWAHFWAVQLWLLILFFVFCTLRELIRALGKERVRRMFFGPMESPAA